MLLFAPDLTILYVNAAHLQMTGRTREQVEGKHMFDVFAPNPEEDDTASARGAIEASVEEMVASGEPSRIEEQQHDLLGEDGKYEQRFWSLTQWPVTHDGKVVAILQRSGDVTERVRQRRLTETVRESAEAVSGMAFFSYDPATGDFVRSPGLDQMFGFAKDEAGEMAEPFFERILPEDLPAVYEELERAVADGPGASVAFDFRVSNPQSEALRFMRVRAGIERDPDGGLPKLYGALVDTTDIEQMREKAQALSERNAALVVESNHRIKNSLAIASAMLSHQMRATEDPAAEKALQASATRIMAISDVHGQLFADTGVELVDAGRMLERFITSFKRTINDEDGRCQIDATVESIPLPSRFAVSLALMLNELLTNAVKYGTSQDEACAVTVAIQLDEGEVELRVVNAIADRKFAQIESEGVGSELVLAFAQQLDGTIESGQKDGNFEVVFRFPLPAEDIELRETDPVTGR